MGTPRAPHGTSLGITWAPPGHPHGHPHETPSHGHPAPRGLHGHPQPAAPQALPQAALCPQETGNTEVRFMQLDLASLRSVRAFASTFLRQEPHLHLLINNAGVSAGGTTEDGFSFSFQVNHLGHFLLTQLLLERLQSCAPSRVVIVASSAHSLECTLA
ncbi:dehydrogenase/reductase SDR family member 13 [Egretta garzetta]|uniref:dehydrogenase/reductase SDR family member 13 n=1 Tax=Egretta garzetta TaxID=188379 RepID=UPI00163B7318|nr:dehydrogenase/reductase SDR family member 13 [Egretta garzetta]